MQNIASIETARADLPAQKSDIHRIEQQIAALLKQQRPARRRLADDTKRQHALTVQLFYHRNCPCCGEVEVLSELGFRTEAGEYDHFSDNRARAGPHETWLICIRCHSAFTRNLSERAQFRAEWDVYQKRRRKIAGAIQPMLL